MTLRCVSVVLHDVAPAHWNRCLRVIAQVRSVARQAGVPIPLTLLVVPKWHNETTPMPFIQWLHRQKHLGNELALHGWNHLDQGLTPQSWWERFKRKHYTNGEGEFSALPAPAASQRLEWGRTWANQQQFSFDGFIAPAWLMSHGTWDSLRNSSFSYTCTLNQVVSLSNNRTVKARSLVFSTRAKWRRWLSRLWVKTLYQFQRNTPLLRLELHPQDCDDPAIQKCWTGILADALKTRQPLKMKEAVQQCVADKDSSLFASGKTKRFLPPSPKKMTQKI